MADEYPKTPSVNDYRKFASEQELLSAIENASQLYAQADFPDEAVLTQSIRTIGDNALPYEKKPDQYTSDDVQILGKRYKAIKSATELARQRYRGFNVASDEELNAYVSQAEADYMKAMRSVLSPTYGLNPLQKYGLGVEEAIPRMIDGVSQLFNFGDQKELERRTAQSNQILEDPWASFGNTVASMTTAVPASVAVGAMLPETALGVGVTGLTGTALRTAPFAVEGAVQGALTPTEEGQSRTQNVIANTALSTLMKPVTYLGGQMFDMFKPQKFVARDTARMLIDDLPKGQVGTDAEMLIRNVATTPSNVVPNARLTTPEYLASQGVEAPNFNQLQDYLRAQPEPVTNQFPFLNANRQTAEATDARIVDAFNGATKEDADAIRTAVRLQEGKDIEKARASKLPINASNVVRFMDKFIKDNPTLEFTSEIKAIKDRMMQDIPVETRVKEAYKLNQDFVANNRVIKSVDEREAIQSVNDIIKNDTVEISGFLKGSTKTFDTSTIEGKIKALGVISRSLRTKTGKDHLRAVYETLVTGQKPYDRVRDLHNIKMDLQAKMQSMTPYQRKEVYQVVKKLDSAISAEVKQWGDYMKNYAIQMNRASQAEAGAIVRGGITDFGMSNEPKLNITSFKDLARRADETYLKGRFGERIKFTPDQAQALTEIRNTAKALQSVQNIGRDTNSQTAQRLRNAKRFEDTLVPNTPFDIAKTGAWLVGRIDRRKLPEVYKMMSDPYYFAEVLRNTPAKDRHLVHAMRSAMIGFNTPILTGNMGNTETQSDDPYEMSDREYTAFMQLSPDEQYEYMRAKEAMSGKQNPNRVIVTPNESQQ